MTEREKQMLDLTRSAAYRHPDFEIQLVRTDDGARTSLAHVEIEHVNKRIVIYHEKEERSDGRNYAL